MPVLIVLHTDRAEPREQTCIIEACCAALRGDFHPDKRAQGWKLLMHVMGSYCQHRVGKEVSVENGMRDTPRVCGNRMENESKLFIFKGAAVVCADMFFQAGHSWHLTVVEKQNLGRNSFIHQALSHFDMSELRLSPDAVLLRMTAPGRAPLVSVP